ncbi:MAG: 30S ribosomal protein S9 [Alphaproteobacteria bacterium]|nr:30S ribosomal protein S9 [Alphaproteobacteria bacterium]MBL0717709.1 30S ribosomal protein S9 [Alphaproteobacteria bacterium]
MIIQKKSVEKKEVYYATGRRKTSVARVFMSPGTGKISINGKKFEVYFKRAVLQMKINMPLELVEMDKRFDIRATVKGGGLSGQAGAIQHGISRAILKVNPDLKPQLRKATFITRDSRKVERKKYGLRKARKAHPLVKR